VERDFPDIAGLALPDQRDSVAVRRVDGSVSVDDVVRDVDLAAGVPVGELRPSAVVAHCVVLGVEVDVEVVDDLVPEPVDAGGRLAVDPRGGPGDGSS